MGEMQKRKIEIDEIMDREKIGLGGWLVFVQAAMLFIILLGTLGAVSKIYSDLFFEAILFLIPAMISIAAMVLFYLQRLGFRVLFIVSALMLALNGFILIQPRNPALYYATLLTLLVVYLSLMVFSYFSHRVNNTLSELGRQLERERRINLYGTDGWLLLFQAHLMLIFGSSLYGLASSITTVKLMGGTGIISRRPIVLIALIPAIAVIACSAICLFLFYKRKPAFKYVYIVLAVIRITIVIIPDFESFFTITVIGGTVIFLPIILALFNSHRVKNTFG